MPYGRRLGWYAIVRHLKPSLLVETGIHDGLGSSVLLRAIERNAAEGVDGRPDLLRHPARGRVADPRALRARHDVRTGVSLGLLAGAVRGQAIDFFVHDSDHRYEYETAEFEAGHRARPGPAPSS